MARLVRQPPNTLLCGQACVAMAAGVSLARAIAAVGHRRATKTRELVAALRALSVPCADRRRRISRARPEYPRRAIVAVHKNGTARLHWMYYEAGRFYDPEGTWPRYDGWRITSYLEIF